LLKTYDEWSTDAYETVVQINDFEKVDAISERINQLKVDIQQRRTESMEVLESEIRRIQIWIEGGSEPESATGQGLASPSLPVQEDPDSLPELLKYWESYKYMEIYVEDAPELKQEIYQVRERILSGEITAMSQLQLVCRNITEKINEWDGSGESISS
jgi:hypothetical protein